MIPCTMTQRAAFVAVMEHESSKIHQIDKCDKVQRVGIPVRHTQIQMQRRYSWLGAYRRPP
jgi:hypothetical protein